MAYGAIEMAVARPGEMSPLVVHGPSGVGKTHLLEGACERIRQLHPAATAVCLSAEQFTTAFLQSLHGGGLPGFGSLSPTPGLAPGAAPGDMDDLRFLRESLQAVKAMGAEDVLDRAWLSVHNYGDAHLRIRDYDQIVRQELGRSLPQIGTEAGIYPGDTLSQADATNIVANAYRYLPNREEYYFAYTYWIIANESGTGHNDAAWNHQALFRPNGHDPLVDILKQEKSV
jgi:hypothetical protein